MKSKSKRHDDSTLSFLITMAVVGFLLLLAILKCSADHNDSPAAVSDKQRVADIAAFYSATMDIDNDGFIETDKCDSLLLTALTNPAANLEAAELTPGQWMRRPVTYPDCYYTNASRSDVSRDMLLGVIYASYVTNDLDRLLRLWQYGVSNDWVMARHGSLHAIYGPGDIALLAQTIFVLSAGEHDYAARKMNLPLQYAKQGYVRHLQAIQVWLKIQVYGDMLPSDLRLIESYERESPNNPLFPMVIGKYDRSVELLLSRYPANRLPDTTLWCDAWPIQRLDNDIGLKPCPNESDEVHTGGELVFISRHIK